MKGTLKDTEAQVRYKRDIGFKVTLVGFLWGEGETRKMFDFNVDHFGDVMEGGQDSERHVGWVIYKKFDGQKKDIIKLKERN
jgi:hypothetical protein